MKEGIILKLHRGRAVVLRPDGSFLSLPAGPDWQEGQVVSLSDCRRQQKRLRALRTLAAAAVLFLVCGLGGRMYLTQTALISIDVNPSVELGINRFGRVISSTARNEEGTDVLAKTDIRYSAYEKAVSDILRTEKEAGFMDKGDVTFTVFAGDKGTEEKLLQNLRSTADSIIDADSRQVSAEYVAVDEQTVSCAHDCGVTAGKYLYLKQLQEVSPDIDMASYSHHSISQLKEDIDACHQAHGSRSAGSTPDSRQYSNRHGHGCKRDQDNAGAHCHKGH